MSSVDERIACWVSPAIRAMQAYHVPAAAGLVKLDAMENPYTCSQALREEWLNALKAAELNRYPDPDAAATKQALRSVLRVPDELALLVGNGSDEIIQMIITVLAAPGRTVLAPEPGFVMYRILAQALGLRYHGVPLQKDFSLDVEAMLAAIEETRPAVIFMASPNNPTGNLFSRNDMIRIIEAAPGLVVVDEAYFIFAGDGCMDLPVRYPHLLVMRTLSKLGLAGLRVGCVAGNEAWIAELDKIRLPYNINVLSQISTDFFLAHYPLLEEQADVIRRDRNVLYQALQRLDGIRVHPSDANFLLFQTTTQTADAVHQALKDRGILIKNLHGTHPLLDQCLRVTVGTAEENASFLKALTASLAGNGER